MNRTAALLSLSVLLVSMPASAADDLFSCTRDDECEVADLGSCDACNGGWDIGVRKGKSEAARVLYGVPRQRGCTERGCQRTAVCNAGKCAVKRDATVIENFVRLGLQRCEKDSECVMSASNPCGCCESPRAVTAAVAAARAAQWPEGLRCPPHPTCDMDCRPVPLSRWRAVCQPVSGTIRGCVAIDARSSR